MMNKIMGTFMVIRQYSPMNIKSLVDVKTSKDPVVKVTRERLGE